MLVATEVFFSFGQMLSSSGCFKLCTKIGQGSTGPQGIEKSRKTQMQHPVYFYTMECKIKFFTTLLQFSLHLK